MANESTRGSDRPADPLDAKVRYGSDVIAETIRALGFDYIALNPGASFRGLHDSLVNHLGNTKPEMILCPHEEHAVALAQGYAKVTGRPMAVAVHSNVGLMHATMGIFNAWADRVQVCVIGSTGPVDAARRRPWADWLHTSRDSASMIRNYIKWDDQPASIEAAVESLIRAKILACTAPCGPTFVSLDASLQENVIDAPPGVPDMRRHGVPALPAPTPAAVAEAARMLRSAKRPVIMMGRMGSEFDHWPARIRLADALNARVITDYKTGAMFPTDHPRHSDQPGIMVTKTNAALIREADVILSLDYIGIAGMLKFAGAGKPVSAKLISVSLDSYLANGWSLDHFSVPATDLAILSTPDNFVEALLRELGESGPLPAYVPPSRQVSKTLEAPKRGHMTTRMLAETLIRSVGTRDVSLVRLPLRWPPDAYAFHHPLDYLGKDGGGGIGSGPGMAIGSALALRGTDRLPIAVLGDGDLFMGINALWTATRYRIPLLIVVVNNRSYYNDVAHQESVARARNRSVENKWIGLNLEDPAPDFATLARGQGWSAEGPVTTLDGLLSAVEAGITIVAAGGCHLIDVTIDE